MPSVVVESNVNSWASVDLAEVLSALCRQCADLAGVAGCSISVTDASREFFSAASSAEWAGALDDFQLSEEAGPTWECCTTGLVTSGEDLGHRGLTGVTLAEEASAHDVVGCWAVPLSSRGETLGAVTLYGGPSDRDEGLLTTAIAVAALAAKAVEHQREQEQRWAREEPAASPEPAPADAAPPLASERDATAEAREARATARDARAAARDVRAAQRDARATARDAQAAARDRELGRHRAAGGPVDHHVLTGLVQARRDRRAAARDRFHARADREAARVDRVVSASERVESSMDGLTGAYRREAGLQELEHEVTRARRTGDSFVLAFVDVNNLKIRNDTLGHIAGDQLLRRIADTVRANVRSYDLVVRYGGDEFVCGFPALDVNDAAARFARINEDLAAYDEASVAFGLAELEDGDSLTDLITRADEVMYANRYRRLSERGNAGHAAHGHGAHARERVAAPAE
jgi:diguanylate cyclase (GGDEF)-like protein